MPDRIRPGVSIDEFRIGPLVHSGAMGNIFQVTRPDARAPMIMKVPRVGPNEPVEGVISFETEATIVPALSGPYVPRCVAVGDLARMPYLVTEWIDGASLEQRLRGGPLPPADVARIGAAIADALHSLHQQDVIHLDLKPANVILRQDGTAALVDFGFAHHARYPDLLAEETRHSAGSKPYISPEQILGTREDPRSDIFSLGVVLYEMATGRFPFGEADTDVRNRLWLDPAPPRAYVPETPPWLQEVILRCLEVDAETRYQSAAHVAFDLRHPDQVALTARAAKMRRAGLVAHLRRFRGARARYRRSQRMPNAHLSRFPIVMVAVDPSHPDEEHQPALQRATAQILSLGAELRLICVSVMRTPRVEAASRMHLEQIVRLRHWVEPLRLPAQRLSLHAIESDDPAESLLEFAKANNVDLIVLGAHLPWATEVAAKAHCSVHLVRV